LSFWELLKTILIENLTQLIGILMLAVGFMFVWNHVRSIAGDFERVDVSVPPTVVNSWSKPKCRYCGVIIDSRAKQCNSCGAFYEN